MVEIKAVAREAGSRSKAAIWTDVENVDPVLVLDNVVLVFKLLFKNSVVKKLILLNMMKIRKIYYQRFGTSKIISLDLDEAEHKANC